MTALMLTLACAASADDGDGSLVEDVLRRERLTGEWWGVRPALEERGVTFDASLWIDWSRNFRGGLRTGSGAHHLFMASLTFDTERLFTHPGGTFHIEFHTNNGDMLSSDLIGDVQIFSNIKDEHRAQLAEAWYEQRFLDDVFRIKLGKIDANTEFAFVEHGLEFLNSSMGFSPTIFVLPTYPDPAAGMALFLDPPAFPYLSFGLFDGALQRGVRTGSRGPGTLFRSDADLFLIGEAGVRWGEEALPGRAGFGAWHHTGRFDRFDDGDQSGSTGFYFVFDQMMWSAGDGGGVGAFLQYGYADARVSEIEHHLGGGIAIYSPLPSRERDVLGIGATWVRLSDRPGFDRGSELAIEAFYQLHVTPWLIVQPDIQFIRHPGGTAGRNAIVGTLRFGFVF